jgi:hypothetical protein
MQLLAYLKDVPESLVTFTSL